MGRGWWGGGKGEVVAGRVGVGKVVMRQRKVLWDLLVSGRPDLGQ